MPHSGENAPAEGFYVVTQGDTEIPNAKVLTEGTNVSIDVSGDRVIWVEIG